MAIDQPSSTRPAADDFKLADIRAALLHLRPPDLAAAAQHDSLAAWLAQWQGRSAPRIERPRLVLFAGIHGASAEARAWAHADVSGRVQALTTGMSLTCGLAEQADADLRLYEIATDLAPRAPTEAAIARAMVYGMTVVEPGVDVLGVATLSPGLQWRAADDDPFDTLCARGGEEIAAAIGSMIAARMAQAPVVCDGMGARLAASLLAQAQPGAADHVRAARGMAGDGLAAVLDGPPTDDSDGADAAAAILALRAALTPPTRN